MKIWFNKKNSLVAIAIVWLLAFLVSVPFLFMANYTDHQCQINITSFDIIYVIFVNTVFIFIPTMVLGILYVYIIITLRNHSNMLFKFEDENGQVCSKNKNRFTKINLIKDQRCNKWSINFSSSTSEYELRKIIPNNKNSNKPNKKPRLSSIEHLQQANEEDLIFLKGGCDCGCKNFKSKRTFSNKPNQRNTIKNNIPLGENIVKCANRIRPSRLRINFTIILSFVTFAFFLCQLPMRIFITWSYCLNYFHKEYMETMSENERLVVSMFSNVSTIIYFFHCISNPIIYNLLSLKFRRAFISFASMNCGKQL